jgi:hypothetical protein
MCFSAAASFGVSAALVPAGIYCVRAALRKDRSYWPFAIIPLGFAAQQFCEGLVWTGLNHNKPALSTTAALAFLFFALSFWPVWLPFSAFWVENRSVARLTFLASAIFGLSWTVLLVGPLVLDPARWLSVEVVHESIWYNFSQLPVYQYVSPDTVRLLYALPIFYSLVACSDKRVRVFCLLLTAAAVVCYLVFRYAFASVWCFFAAVLALDLCYVMLRLPEPSRDRKKPTEEYASALG